MSASAADFFVLVVFYFRFSGPVASRALMIGVCGGRSAYETTTSLYASNIPSTRNAVPLRLIRSHIHGQDVTEDGGCLIEGDAVVLEI